MFGRAPVLALAALALAATALLPASASADVGPGGYGISDDLHRPRHLSQTRPSDELEPKSFRLNASWAALGDPGYLAQIQDRIRRGRTPRPAPRAGWR